MDHLDDKIFSFIAQINKAIAHKKDLEFVEDFLTNADGFTLIIDAVLLRDKEVLAIFRFKPFQEELRGQSIPDTAIPNYFQYKYFVTTNGKESVILNKFNNESAKITDVTELINYISKIPTAKEINALKDQIAKIIEKSVTDFLKNAQRPDVNFKKKIPLIAQHFSYKAIIENLFFDENGEYFKMCINNQDLDNFENQIFHVFLDDVKPSTKIYRYTSLDTLFATINYGSIRMNGITGMNDISEVEYVDRYLDNSFNIYKKVDEISSINERFIICCSTLSDNLNQWRLYGDDCKGAALVFNVLDKQKLPGLQLKHISYGVKKNGVNFHFELELIKYLMQEVKSNTGYSLRLKTLEVWKHFFKSYEYKEEKEVRLLLINNANNYANEENNTSHNGLSKDWNLTYSHKILAPFITISLLNQSLPIELEKIVLGSKCPEKVLNQKQFELFLKEKGWKYIKVELSRINSYR